MSLQTAPQLLVVTGEASGDHHGAMVVEKLKELLPEVRVCGIGGDALQAAGMEILYHSRHISVVGLLEVLSHAPAVLRAFNVIRRALRSSPPTLVLLIDYPDFNVRIAKLAKKYGLPVLYYISPQLWAWRRGRAKKMAGIIDKMAVIFPFEVPFYEDVGLDAEFVGHPLLDREVELPPRSETLQAFSLSDARPVVGLLPGSRAKEIERLLPDMLRAAERILQRVNTARFVLPIAPGIDADQLRRTIDAHGVRVHTVEDGFYRALDVCDIAVVASGTATLQTALMEKPMVILYRVAPLTYHIGRLLIRVDCIGLANIVAGRKIVPELIQNEVTPERIAGEVLDILESPGRMQQMITGLKSIKASLGSGGASEKVARIAADMLTKNG